MKRNFNCNNRIKVTILCVILTLIFLVKPNTCYAAQSENKQIGITELEDNKVYKYDLNGDSKADKILYKFTTNEDEYTVTLKLYINDKLCLSRTSRGFGYQLNICDLDINDNYLDLYGYATMESDCINKSFFTRYNGNKLVSNIKFELGNISKKLVSNRYSLTSIEGDGRFTVSMDTPIYSEAIGSYYCNVSYQLKDNKFSLVPVKTYTLGKFSKEYEYKTKKSFSVYSKVGEKKSIYSVKKGEIVTFDKLYVTKSGKLYFRINNSKGMKGWIKSDQEGLFSNVPAWG